MERSKYCNLDRKILQVNVLEIFLQMFDDISREILQRKANNEALVDSLKSGCVISYCLPWMEDYVQQGTFNEDEVRHQNSVRVSGQVEF